jgi:hypothetical protein
LTRDANTPQVNFPTHLKTSWPEELHPDPAADV